MTDFNDGVRYIKGIGEKKAEALQKLGISTLRDLVSYFPRDYEDRSVIFNIEDLPEGENACFSAVVITYPRYQKIRGGLDTVKLRAADGSASVDITYFNQHYVKDQLKYGEEYIFYGKLYRNGGRASMNNPLFEKAGEKSNITGRIVPVYRLRAGITQKLLMSSVSQALRDAGNELPEILPESIRRNFGLCGTYFAYKNIHFPKDMQSLAAAKRRLVFEELFVLSCALGQMGGREDTLPGYIINSADVNEFYASLPFELTGAQKRAMLRCMDDMTSGRAMNRLLQGDVGSGKTAVAAGLIWLTHKTGLQSAFMAPTEILAEQHYSTLSAMLSGFGVKTLLLTGSMGLKAKREARERIKSGEADLVVGTHAIISENVEFTSLALAITDEQHRFGVYQRSALSEKGDRPHVLVMSATPIPRTLALIIYGDLDISVIDELPPGRQTVDTFLVKEQMRGRINAFIAKLAAEGRQIFIVCPLIEESENMDLKSAHEYAENLKTVFPELKIAELHGRMKAVQKDTVMSSFAAGEYDILVSTTVIEVGVDVPNAALMVIENAERFGLSQLHQLRGRVGRGKHKSYCIMFNGGSGDAAERLKVLCETNDGFKISEEDLKQRGPGDFFGSRQHGLPEMKLADLSCDMPALEEAQNAAAELLRLDSELSAPENASLKARVAELFGEIRN